MDRSSAKFEYGICTNVQNVFKVFLYNDSVEKQEILLWEESLVTLSLVHDVYQNDTAQLERICLLIWSALAHVEKRKMIITC